MKSGYISLIGLPNTGKSTLLNRILGEQLSIATRKAQTTRHKIVGIHNLPGGQLVFLDTPGIHDSNKPLNRYMMEVVDSALGDADVICWIIDVKNEAAEQIKNSTVLTHLAKHPEKKIIIAVNKVDLVMDKTWETIARDYKEATGFENVVAVSAKTGFGVDELAAKLQENLPDGEPFYPDDIFTEHPVRFLVAEIIRENILELMHEELPYSVAVEIESYKEEENIHRIQAAIIVDKDSQKGMMIGAGGRMIKKIGELSRKKIENLVGTKVFLKLFVKVEKNWTKDPAAIKKIYSHT